MGDERSREGNGAVVAIVLGLGIVVLLGIVFVFGAGFLFFLRASPPVQVTFTKTAALPTPTAPATPLAPSPGQLPIEVDGSDQILVNGETKTLDELKQTFKEIKNGNSLFTEIKIKFSGSSEAKTQEVALVLKEACILFEVDPTGTVPAELTPQP